MAPNHTIKRHDTEPPFNVAIEDCDGVLNLTDDSLILEANMWARAKLKTAITNCDTSFRLASDVGFEQAMIGDIIVMDRVRMPEHMLVTGFDEENKLLSVQRGYNGTIASKWPKGNALRIFRIMGAPAVIQSTFEDIDASDGILLRADGSVVATGEDENDVLVETLLTYSFRPQDTCLPGCYWMEFKLIKMAEEVPVGGGMSTISTASMPSMPSMLPDISCVVPSDAIRFTPSDLTPSDFNCGAKCGFGVESIRRFPSCGEGFLVKIENSPTEC